MQKILNNTTYPVSFTSCILNTDLRYALVHIPTTVLPAYVNIHFTRRTKHKHPARYPRKKVIPLPNPATSSNTSLVLSRLFTPDSDIQSHQMVCIPLALDHPLLSTNKTLLNPTSTTLDQNHQELRPRHTHTKKTENHPQQSKMWLSQPTIATTGNL